MLRTRDELGRNSTLADTGGGVEERVVASLRAGRNELWDILVVL
jgi:hypothetical protein